MGDKALIITDIERVYSAELFPDTPSIPVNPRSHHVLAFLLEGEMENRIEDDLCHMGERDVLYVPRGSVDVSLSPTGCKYIAVEFSTLHDRFVLPRHTAGTTLKNPAAMDPFSHGFQKLLKVWNSENMNKKGKCFEILYGITNQALEHMHNMSHQKAQYKRLAPAIEYIHAHCLEPGFTLEKLADDCQISRVHLNRLFQSLYHTSLGKYVLMKRIEYAKVLLMDSRNNISEVASRCGWADVYVFSHAFKRITGSSPTVWRKNH